MTLIKWRDEFKLGIASVDEEHKEMIDLINETYNCHQDHKSRVTVLDFLGEIYARISSHFALEEKLMKEQGYDEYLEHKQDHEDLLDEICEFMDDYDREKPFDEEALGNFLENWFVAHFKSKDSRLHKYLG
jgi:hemerythrin